MTDLRTQLPQCPLEYQVPHIPGSHTALVIEINAADIEWQERMLPWTLAGLINNTDLVMKGVHLYVVCEDDLRDRIRTALKRFDLPPGTIITKDEDSKPLILFGKYGHRYDSVCMLDINYWAFRGIGKSQDRADTKLPLGHVLRHTWGWAVADVSLNPVNEIALKDTWVQMGTPLPPFSQQEQISGSDLYRDWLGRHPDHLVDTSARAKWLHDANIAVYGEDYKKRNKNVAVYFFNEADPNWHLDASILQYSACEANDPMFTHWASEWKHLGTEPLIALWLLKTKQHAYNLSESVMIESSYSRAAYPRLCNMRFADVQGFRYATTELLGAQLNIAMN